jgi:hypothetical protein
MAENDGSCACRFDQDAVRIRGDISNVAAAAVDGERRGDRNRAVVAAAEAVDLGDAALALGSLEGGAGGRLAAGIGVDAVGPDPQYALRPDLASRKRQHYRTKRRAP